MLNNDSKNEAKKEAWWQPAIILFFRFSAWIVAPVLLGVFVGKWLDRKYDSEPWLFLLSVGIAFVISMFGLIYSVVKEYARIEKENIKNKKDKDGNKSS